MAKGRDFISQLIGDGVISSDQANEAKRVARTSGKKLHDSDHQLGVCTGGCRDAGRGRRSMAWISSI